IVGSTEKAAELGDRRWRELLEAQVDVLRRELARFKGREVKQIGDGCLATFDGPQRAIRCGQALVQAVKSIGVDIRVGLHTGEVEMMGDDVGGIAVHIASRINGLAEPGRVFCSGTVKDLVVGSGIAFEDQGVQILKGARVPMTVGDLIRERGSADPTRPLISFGEVTVTRGAYLARCLRVAALLDERLKPPRHVGVLMENRLEYLDVLGGAALCGAVVVGINATRRGPELERDIRHTDCSLVITDDVYGGLLDGLDVPPTLRVGSSFDGGIASADPTDRGWAVDEADLFLLIFTSGTTGAPKAVRCSHKRMIGTGTMVADLVGLTEDDCTYVSLPLFHSNPLMCGYIPTLVRGGRMALARRFSVSAFLPEVRAHGSTYFPYSGKPLSFLVASDEHDDDADNPLRICYGNEGSFRIVKRFEQRFGCRVIDGFGPSEGAMGFPRRPGDPPGSVGKPPANIRVLKEDGTMCPAARFGAEGQLLNPDECVGEIVNVDGVGRFEGYYNNPEAEAQRVRDGKYWSGDLGYVDAYGFLYFAGRTEDWIRVDAENFPPRGPGDDRRPAVPGARARRERVAPLPQRAARAVAQMAADLRGDRSGASARSDRQGARSRAAPGEVPPRPRAWAGLLAGARRERLQAADARRRSRTP
ncbi:MAG: hypothetical protein E6G68_10305, partial [Actinobacteria bacterium]